MIFFQNPDRQWYKKTISQWVRRSRAMNKYEYILDNYLEQGTVNVILPVTGKNKLHKQFNILFRFIRFYIWIKINKLNYKSFNVVYSYCDLNENDLVFLFFHDNLAKVPPCCDLNEYKKNIISAKCKFLVHLNHYVYNISDGSDLCSKIKNIEFVAETNLYEHAPFFKSFFDWYDKPVKVLPFCVQDRFEYLSGSKRVSKVIATGAVTFKVEDREFADFFGTDILQPKRKYLLKNAVGNDYIHVAISEWKDFKNKGLIKTLGVNLKNYLYSFIEKLQNKNKETFYNIDLPIFYNKFKFVACPAEIIGLPGIGAFEAMACGAIFITDEGELYDDYGFEENINYISYDGTIDNLVFKIKSMLDDKEHVAFLRKNSLKIINEKMRAKACINIFEKFVNNIL